MNRLIYRASRAIGLMMCALGAAMALTQQAAYADADGCTLDRMELAPDTAVAPCSELLATSDLTPVARAEALYIRGRSYHRTARLGLAGKDYDSALELTPSDHRIYLDRANLAFRRGDYRFGLSDVQKSLDLNQRNARAIRIMGALLADVGREDEALGAYAEALAIDPSEAFALLFRSRLFASKLKLAEALTDANALVGIPPDIINRGGYIDEELRLRNFHVVALDHRASLFHRLGDVRAAERDLDAAVAHERGGDALLARGEFLARQPGRGDESLRDLAEAHSLLPLSNRLQRRRGFALVDLKRYESAGEAFDNAIHLDPFDAIAYRMRALVHRQLGRIDEATRDYEMAVGLSASIRAQSIRTLRHVGYWTAPDAPDEVTPALREALRACMIDADCS